MVDFHRTEVNGNRTDEQRSNSFRWRQLSILPRGHLPPSLLKIILIRKQCARLSEQLYAIKAFYADKRKLIWIEKRGSTSLKVQSKAARTLNRRFQLFSFRWQSTELFGTKKVQTVFKIIIIIIFLGSSVCLFDFQLKHQINGKFDPFPGFQAFAGLKRLRTELSIH